MSPGVITETGVPLHTDGRPRRLRVRVRRGADHGARDRIGALPFFFFETISDRGNVALWGFASGIMLYASLFGLVQEGLAEGTVVEIGVGMLAGVLLIVLAHGALIDAEIDPQEYAEADYRKFVLILGVLTVHRFPEGIVVGVSFADLGLPGGTELFGFTIPLLDVFITLAISIHNVSEATALLKTEDSTGITA